MTRAYARLATLLQRMNMESQVQKGARTRFTHRLDVPSAAWPNEMHPGAVGVIMHLITASSRVSPAR